MQKALPYGELFNCRQLPIIRETVPSFEQNSLVFPASSRAFLVLDRAEWHSLRNLCQLLAGLVRPNGNHSRHRKPSRCVRWPRFELCCWKLGRPSHSHTV
jgi:hypothetical protein